MPAPSPPPLSAKRNKFMDDIEDALKKSFSVFAEKVFQEFGQKGVKSALDSPLFIPISCM